MPASVIDVQARPAQPQLRHEAQEVARSEPAMLHVLAEGVAVGEEGHIGGALDQPPREPRIEDRRIERMLGAEELLKPALDAVVHGSPGPYENRPAAAPRRSRH